MRNSIWFLAVYYGARCADTAVVQTNPAQPAEPRRQPHDVDVKAVLMHQSCVITALEDTADASRIIVIAP